MGDVGGGIWWRRTTNVVAPANIAKKKKKERRLSLVNGRKNISRQKSRSRALWWAPEKSGKRVALMKAGGDMAALRLWRRNDFRQRIVAAMAPWLVRSIAAWRGARRACCGAVRGIAKYISIKMDGLRDAGENNGAPLFGARVRVWAQKKKKSYGVAPSRQRR